MMVGKVDLKCEFCGGDDFIEIRKRIRPLTADGRVIPSRQTKDHPGWRLGLVVIGENDKVKPNTNIYKDYHCKTCDKVTAKYNPRQNVLLVIRKHDNPRSAQGAGKYRRYNPDTGEFLKDTYTQPPGSFLWTIPNRIKLSGDDEKMLEVVQEMLAMMMPESAIRRILQKQFNVNEDTANKYIVIVRMRTLRARAQRARMTPRRKYVNDVDKLIELYESIVRRWGSVESTDATRLVMEAARELKQLYGAFYSPLKKELGVPTGGTVNNVKNSIKIYLPASPRARDAVGNEVARLNVVPEQEKIQLPAPEPPANVPKQD